jgi:hypothetical protein
MIMGPCFHLLSLARSMLPIDAPEISSMITVKPYA